MMRPLGSYNLLRINFHNFPSVCLSLTLCLSLSPTHTDNHPGDGVFSLLSKFKDDIDVFRMIKCFLGFKGSVEEMKDWWRRDTEINHCVKELNFK